MQGNECKPNAIKSIENLDVIPGLESISQEEGEIIFLWSAKLAEVCYDWQWERNAVGMLHPICLVLIVLHKDSIKGNEDIEVRKYAVILRHNAVSRTQVSDY